MDNPIVLVILAMTFAAPVLLVQAASFYIQGKRDEEEAKVRDRLGIQQWNEDDEALASLLRESASDGAIDALGAAGDDIQKLIQQAGMTISVSTLLVQMVIALIVSFVVLFFTMGGLASLGCVAFGYLPYWWVSSTAAKRAAKMLDQMPDALEMMARAMQAGAGLSDCFRLVQVEMTDPIAAEFGRVADEVTFGKEWRTALQLLIERNPSLFELRLLVSSLLLQRETGGNMIETLARVAKLIRQRYAFDNKVKAMTAEARTSGMVLALMPLGVALLIFVFNPAYLTPLFEHPLGQIVLVYAVFSYGIGLFLMSAMSTVEV